MVWERSVSGGLGTQWGWWWFGNAVGVVVVWERSVSGGLGTQWGCFLRALVIILVVYSGFLMVYGGFL